jgi:2-succinyl-6-hydroxy-2,4-cyclohexadiene-1-carboxylate synthase
MKRLLLLHGFTGAPASFDELAGHLQERAPELALLAPLILGHGADASPVTSFEQEVDRLAEEVARRNFSGCHLCGYSMGARLALGLLARHADLFGGATLVGVQPGLASERERQERRAADARWCRVLEERGIDEFVALWEREPTFASQRGLAERFERALQAQAEIRRAHRATELARALEVLGLAEMPDYRGVLARLALPLRLVVGELDAKFLQLARELANEHAAARLVVVPGAGHNVVLEAPERLAQILLEAVT